MLLRVILILATLNSISYARPLKDMKWIGQISADTLFVPVEYLCDKYGNLKDDTAGCWKNAILKPSDTIYFSSSRGSGRAVVTKGYYGIGELHCTYCYKAKIVTPLMPANTKYNEDVVVFSNDIKCQYIEPQKVQVKNVACVTNALQKIKNKFVKDLKREAKNDTSFLRKIKQRTIHNKIYKIDNLDTLYCTDSDWAIIDTWDGLQYTYVSIGLLRNNHYKIAWGKAGEAGYGEGYHVVYIHSMYLDEVENKLLFLIGNSYWEGYGKELLIYDLKKHSAQIDSTVLDIHEG
jgi:hypothetical protein